MEKRLEAIHKILAKCLGQLALALARRKLNRVLLVEQVEQVEQALAGLKELLSTITPEQ